MVLGLLEHVQPQYFELESLGVKLLFTVHIFFSEQSFYGNNASVNSSCAQSPPTPPPPGYCAAFACLVSPGGGALASFSMPGGRAFASPGSCQHITTQRILLGKQADRLICQGREKIEEVCKGMFSILCMHFFIAYQARIT